MKNFNQYLTELRNPPEIGQYRKDVIDHTVVDNRNDSWKNTLPYYFDSYGFKRVGDGKYASVYVKNGYPYAIKVFMKDVAYLKYLKWVMENQTNPFVPKIKGKVIRITPTIYAIRMEKLVNYTQSWGYDSTKFFELLKYPKDFLNGEIIGENISNKDQNLVSLAKLMIGHDRLSDIHYGNIMTRLDEHRTPVLVDPFYNFFDTNQMKFTIDPNDLTGLENLF